MNDPRVGRLLRCLIGLERDLGQQRMTRKERELYVRLIRNLLREWPDEVDLAE